MERALKADLERAVATIDIKPLLRGWSHAVAAIGAVPLTVALTMRTDHDPGRMTAMLVYGIVMVQLYTVSAVYHLGSWRGRVRRVLRELDHANIFGMIAATYTPIATVALAGKLRVAVLVAIWTQAAIGSVLTIFLLGRARWRKTLLYASMGIIGLAVMGKLASTLPATAVLMFVTGSALYILGGVVYTLRWPDPLPRVFGFHEVFHVLVIAAGAIFAATIWIWVVPFS